MPFSIYMYTIRFIELTAARQNSKPVSCKMHSFLQNAISIALLYFSLYEPISKRYIYKNSAVHLSDCRFTFLRETGSEKPDYYITLPNTKVRKRNVSRCYKEDKNVVQFLPETSVSRRKIMQYRDQTWFFMH